MSDTEDWLRAHRELMDNARVTELGSALVQLAAVLVLAEVEDEQIYDHLHGLCSRLTATPPLGWGFTCRGGASSSRQGHP